MQWKSPWGVSSTYIGLIVCFILSLSFLNVMNLLIGDLTE